LNIGAGLDLATQDSIRMGVKIGDRRYFKGRIAQMQVYNAALSQEQIKAIQQRTQVSGENAINSSRFKLQGLGHVQKFWLIGNIVSLIA